MAEFTKLKNSNKKFVKIKCPECGGETITYSRGSSEVKCIICNAVIARPTGGLIEYRGEITGEFQ